MTEMWKYKTASIDPDDHTIFWEEASRWIKFDDLGETEWELCHAKDRFAVFKRRVVQEVAESGLLPCPFCASYGNSLGMDKEPLGMHGQTVLYFVKCQLCYTRGPGAAGDMEEAIERWNKRARAIQ